MLNCMVPKIWKQISALNHVLRVFVVSGPCLQAGVVVLCLTCENYYISKVSQNLAMKKFEHEISTHVEIQVFRQLRLISFFLP